MSGNNVEIGTKELGTVASEDDNPNEVIGFLMFSTTGEVTVEREWLMNQFEEQDLPQSLLPREISNWQAYRRAKNAVQNEVDLKTYSVKVPGYSHEFDCELELKKSNEHGSNVYLLYTNIFYPEDIIGKSGGDWQETRIGKIDFHRPEKADLPGAMVTDIEVEKDNVHYDYAEKFFKRARELEKDMRNSHNFNDLQNILEEFRYRANAVEVRRSVYFIPAHHQDSLEALMQVWDKIDQFKDEGERVRIDKTPVVDMEDQRELVARRVRDKLEGMVDSIVGEVVEEFQENDKQTADAAANEVLSQLEDSENIAGTYNQLIGTRLSIKEILEDQREQMQEESEEIIENVLNQQTFDDLE